MDDRPVESCARTSSRWSAVRTCDDDDNDGDDDDDVFCFGKVRTSSRCRAVRTEAQHKQSRKKDCCHDGAAAIVVVVVVVAAWR